MRRFLVTGGAGFIGRHFIDLLLEQPHNQVVSVDLRAMAHPPRPCDPGRLQQHRLDVGDSAVMQPLLAAFQPDCLVHFAASTHVDASIAAPDDYVANNILAHHRLLHAIRDYWLNLDSRRQQTFRFIQVSTDEVYGQLASGDRAFTEDAPYQPNNPYSATKAAADHLVRAYHVTWGLPVITTLSSNNYGPGQTLDKLIPKLIHRAFQERELPLYGDGSHRRDWLYVEDHCRGILEIIERGEVGEHYNIGGQCEKSNREIAELICRMVDDMEPAAIPRRERIRFVPDRPGHDFRYALNGDKLARISAWRPTTSLEQGLQQTLAWYISRRPDLRDN